MRNTGKYLAVLALLVLLTLLVSRRSGNTPPKVKLPAPDWFFISPDFLQPGRKLAIRGSGLSTISPINMREIRLTRDGKFKQVVRSSQDLVGEVKIDTPEKALHYVRLFTSPNLVHLFPPPGWIEVIPARTLKEKTYWWWQSGLVGHTLQEAYRLRVKDDSRYFGVVSDAEWNTSGFPSPKVASRPGGFIVERLLLQLNAEALRGEVIVRTPVVTLVSEQVTRDGRIERKTLKRDRANFHFVYALETK